MPVGIKQTGISHNSVLILYHNTLTNSLTAAYEALIIFITKHGYAK